ncbi:unnamed protein product [Prorocentrum cordatum]|uniref:Uncharacterized protein n=1 Tax=Prorocentrum cordatum TaxID=2364126 RepID=A0ABN9VPA6_9DINO|nr:unnamed protein product [Polarella glacialis]
MFVDAKKVYHSQRWSRVGKHTREAEAFKITRGLVDQNLTHFSFEPVASDAQAQYVAACDSWWGKYVCHKIIKTDDDERRATWIMRNNTGDDGFEHNTKSFESLFYPGYFMQLEKPWVRLSKPGGRDFSRAASWKVEFAQLAS